MELRLAYSSVVWVKAVFFNVFFIFICLSIPPQQCFLQFCSWTANSVMIGTDGFELLRWDQILNHVEGVRWTLGQLLKTCTILIMLRLASFSPFNAGKSSKILLVLSSRWPVASSYDSQVSDCYWLKLSFKRTCGENP